MRIDGCSTVALAHMSLSSNVQACPLFSKGGRVGVLSDMTNVMCSITKLLTLFDKMTSLGLFIDL